MKNQVYRALQTLFKVALCACFGLGALLVVGQLAGVVALQPEWITESKRLLLRPTMVCAVAFGLLAYAASYFAPEGIGGSED